MPKGACVSVEEIKTPEQGCRLLLLAVVLQAKKDLTAKSKINQAERQSAQDFLQNGAKVQVARLLGYDDDIFNGLEPKERN